VAFLMVGPPKDLSGLAEHLRGSTSEPLCLHLVADSSLPLQLAERWRMRLHSLERMPPRAKMLHRGFANLTHGPGAIYMWKPLLHYLLPFERLIVLDSDVALLRDLAELAHHFDAFSEEAVVGLAQEQAPFYFLNGYPKIGGVNGGVQLLDLEAMRRPGSEYERQLHKFAAGDYGDIGYLGDQNFFSKLRSLRPELIHILDCGWNRQLSYHLCVQTDSNHNPS
ncbi:MAG: hypothetical protein SGPRY_006091, partial [Prymnesium sp.]